LQETREALGASPRATTLGIPHEMLLLDLYATLRLLMALPARQRRTISLNRIFSTFCMENNAR
jgi:tRNA modification GTPase